MVNVKNYWRSHGCHRAMVKQQIPLKALWHPALLLIPRVMRSVRLRWRGEIAMPLETGISPMLRLLFSQERWERVHVRHCWCRPRLHTPSNAPPLSSLLFFSCQSSSLRSTRQEWKDSSQWIMLFSASVEMLMAQHLLLFRSPTFASIWLCKASYCLWKKILWNSDRLKRTMKYHIREAGTEMPPFSMPCVQFHKYKKLFSLGSYPICFTHWLSVGLRQRSVGLWQRSVGRSTQHSSAESENLWKQDF